MHSRPRRWFPICVIFKAWSNGGRLPSPRPHAGRGVSPRVVLRQGLRCARGDQAEHNLLKNSSKIIHAIVWLRSPSFVSSSSYRSELGPSSNSLSWTEKSETTKRDIFDDYGGMKSGSHLHTLGRLYASEKKLYEEVKATDQIRQEKKCVQLRNQDAKGSELRCAEKTKTM